MSHARTSIRLAMLATLVGGFLDAYSFMSRGGVFAGAQSGNIVQLGIHIARRDGSEVLRLLAPILGFVAGVVVASVLNHDRMRPIVRDGLLVALGIDVVLLGLIGALPPSAADTPISAFVSFVAGIHLATFRQLHEWSYTTTIAMGNIVNAVGSVVNVIFRPDPAERLRAWAFTAVVAAFLVGASLGGVATVIWEERAILGAVPLLLGTLGWLLLDRRGM